jgi:uncharacterized membrane protein YfcA
MGFETLLVAAAVAAGAVAAITGFGIGSLLTPALTMQLDARVAVAAVSIPHVIGTAFRFWLLRATVDRRLLLSFGLTSAAGGVTGALLQRQFAASWLLIVFGSLLLFTAAAEIIGFGRRMRFRGPAAWIAGALSGLLGGLVGNQGGIRSAALLGVDLPKTTFVGTATAVALMVDGARLPIYLWHLGDRLFELRFWIGLATLGVLLGTLLGYRLLARIPERWFRRIVAVVLAVLGSAMLARGVLAR